MNKPGPRFVTTIDLKTHTTTTIPAKELAPGMIQVSFNGREGVFWAKAADVLNTVNLTNLSTSFCKHKMNRARGKNLQRTMSVNGMSSE